MAGDEWTRMTVGRLKLALDEALEEGVVTSDSVVFVDSDPEGNQSHPMRAISSPVVLKPGRYQGDQPIIDESATTVAVPAAGIWFGVGY